MIAIAGTYDSRNENQCEIAEKLADSMAGTTPLNYLEHVNPDEVDCLPTKSTIGALSATP